MAEIPAFLLRHEITVEPYTGAGAFGPTYDQPVPVRAFVDQKRRLVRSDTGEQVVSETTIYCRLAVTAPPKSRITLPDGHTAEVITASRRDGGGLATPDHLELALT